MQIKLWMTPDPVTVEPKALASKTLLLMQERRFRRVPVVDEGRLVGIVTREGLTGWLRYLAGRSDASREERDFQRLLVENVMTPSPFTVRPDTPLEEAARLMLERKVGGLPVVEEGRVVGIVSESDIFRALVKILGWHHPGLRVVALLPPGGAHDLLEAARACRVEILSLLTVPDYSPTHRLVSVCVSGEGSQTLLEMLRTKQIQILSAGAHE